MTDDTSVYAIVGDRLVAHHIAGLIAACVEYPHLWKAIEWGPRWLAEEIGDAFDAAGFRGAYDVFPRRARP